MTKRRISKPLCALTVVGCGFTGRTDLDCSWVDASWASNDVQHWEVTVVGDVAFTSEAGVDEVEAMARHVLRAGRRDARKRGVR